MPRRDRRARRDRERRLGAFVLAAALGVALLLVGIRLASNGGEENVAQVAPTAAPLPSPPPTVAPTPTATPPPARPSPAPVAADGPVPDGRNVVCIDPGHGGSDRGNTQTDDDGNVLHEEKDFTLAHALDLGERLRARGIEVVLTRTTDVEANPENLDLHDDGEVAPPGGEATSQEADDLQARINTCNGAGADLLVSVHYNGAENRSLQGYEVWYNDERPFSDRSEAFAVRIYQLLGARVEAAGYAMVPHGIGVEDFFMLGPGEPNERDPSRMPGVIVEGGYLSNDEDAAFISSDAAAEAIVGAYDQAIIDYFAEFPG